MLFRSALFPPGRGGGEGVAHGYKGKGVTNHLLIEGNGLPLALTSTPANGDERQQVAILLGRVKVYHGYGRPRSCPNEIHADKGYDSKALRVFLRTKGIRPVIPKRNTPRRQKRGRPSPKSSFRWKVERCHAWLQRKFRRLTTRWERRSKYWDGFLCLAVTFCWVPKLICG